MRSNKIINILGSEKILNCPLELISNEHNPSQSELISAPVSERKKLVKT
jgi:hypothetical protein